MASYYSNSEFLGDVEGWHSDLNIQDSFSTSESMDEYRTGSYFQPQPGPGSLLQVYDVRNISWDTVPMETPGANHNEVLTNFDSILGSHCTIPQSLLESFSDTASTVHWPPTHAATWLDREQSATHTQSSAAESLSTFMQTPVPKSDSSRPEVSEVLHPSSRLPSAGNQHVAAHFETKEPVNDPSPYEDGLTPRRQDQRFAGDEYTARWVRGDRYDRAGWCSRCSSWHKLKDSAYWYHMHYSHGISCMTGKPFDLPVAWRSAQGSIGYEALCSACNQWVPVGRAERWRTPYFRHAYKCQVKNNPNLQRSPRKTIAKPSVSR